MRLWTFGATALALILAGCVCPGKMTSGEQDMLSGTYRIQARQDEPLDEETEKIRFQINRHGEGWILTGLGDDIQLDESGWMFGGERDSIRCGKSSHYAVCVERPGGVRDDGTLVERLRWILLVIDRGVWELERIDGNDS